MGGYLDDGSLDARRGMRAAYFARMGDGFRNHAYPPIRAAIAKLKSAGNHCAADAARTALVQSDAYLAEGKLTDCASFRRQRERARGTSAVWIVRANVRDATAIARAGSSAKHSGNGRPTPRPQ